ncbi:MAG: hypothetical protein ACLFTL_11790, partial [Alphaproteobacteria bacterium]
MRSQHLDLPYQNADLASFGNTRGEIATAVQRCATRRRSLSRPPRRGEPDLRRCRRTSPAAPARDHDVGCGDRRGVDVPALGVDAAAVACTGRGR